MESMETPHTYEIDETSLTAEECSQLATDCCNSLHEELDNLPIAYHFRFTFSDQDKELKCLEDKNFISSCKRLHKRTLMKFLNSQYIHQNKYTSGFEIRNKNGENCKAHFHLCFFSKRVKQTMVRTIKRFLQDEDQDTTGVQCYYFKEYTPLDNLDKFWRYPLKQNLNLNCCGGHPQDYLEQQHAIAKESYAIRVQVNQAKLDKKDNLDTLFQRVFSKIKKTDLPKNAKNIAKIFIETYIEEDRPINRQTIQGYVLNTEVKLGLTTPDQILTEWGY